MERKKVLIFETTKTLMRAYELALRGSPWVVMKIQQEGRLFPAIESSSPDAVIVEHRALSGEVRDALGMLPLPVVFCAKEKDGLPAGRIHLPRPFSCDELIGALNASLEWNPDLVGSEAAVAEEGGEEEPFVLTEPEEEILPSVVPMDPEEEKFVPDESPLSEPAPSFVSETVELLVNPEVASQESPMLEEKSQPLKEVTLAGSEEIPAEVKETPEVSLPPADESPAMSFTDQIAERIEERVVEELVPSGVEIPEGAALPEMIRALVRRELREVMKEYFWEEAPILMRQVIEEELRNLATKQ